MNKLGLIGGTGPESTIEYYKGIEYGVQQKSGRSFFPNLTIEILSVFDELSQASLIPLANGSEIFMEKLKKVFTEHMINNSDIPEDMRYSKMVSLRVCYFAGGIVNLYKQWFRGDLDCTLNDIAMEVSKLLQLEAKELF